MLRKRGERIEPNIKKGPVGPYGNILWATLPVEKAKADTGRMVRQAIVVHGAGNLFSAGTGFKQNTIYFRA